MTLVRAVILPLALLLLAAPVPCLRLVGDAVALGRRGALTALGAEWSISHTASELRAPLAAVEATPTIEPESRHQPPPLASSGVGA